MASDGALKRRRELGAGLGVFALAAAVRLIYLSESSESPTFLRPIVDSLVYDKTARSLAAGKGFGDGFLWQAVLYPSYLALIYHFSSMSVVAAKYFQAIVGSLTCLLTYLLGKRIFGFRTGLIAGVVTALYGPLVFYDGELLSAGLEAFWAVLLILLLLHARSAPGFLTFFTLGICGGLAALTRPNFIPFVVAASLWLAYSFFRQGLGPKLQLRWFFCALGGLAFVCGPVALLNSRINGHFGILPSSGGINMYIGNNPAYCETINTRPGTEWARLTRLPVRAGLDDPWEQAGFFYDRVREYALDQPRSFLMGLGGKTQRFFSSHEIPRNMDIYLFRSWSAVIRLLVWKTGPFGFPFGILFPLACAGVYIFRRSVPGPLLLFLTLYPLSIILVFATGRYRIPTIPILAILAAAGGSGVVDAARKRRWPTVGGAAAVFAFSLGVSVLPVSFCEEKINYEAELYNILGFTAHFSGEEAQATRYLEKAVALDPSFPDARNHLGIVYAQQGRRDEAIREFRSALRLKPDFSEAHNHLGVVLDQEGLAGEALAHFRESIRLEFYDPMPYYNLANALFSQGDLEGAANNYRRALAIDAKYYKAHNNLGNTLLAQGNTDEAIAHYREALRLEPEQADALNNLAWSLATRAGSSPGELAEAVRSAELACRLTEYRQPRFLDTLAAAYAASGRFAAAIETARKALSIARPAAERESVAETERRLELYRSGRPFHERAGDFRL